MGGRIGFIAGSLHALHVNVAEWEVYFSHPLAEPDARQEYPRFFLDDDVSPRGVVERYELQEIHTPQASYQAYVLVAVAAQFHL